MRLVPWVYVGVFFLLIILVIVSVTSLVFYLTPSQDIKQNDIQNINNVSPILPFLFNIRKENSLNFMQMAAKHGMGAEEFDIYTKDKYILKMFHIPGDKKRPVLLMHGFLDTSDTFFLRGNGSLVSALWAKGYDVWVANFRGNKYSRAHVLLDPDKHTRYWDFSFHEYGYYDLPAFIDFILQKTGQESLHAITHSIGGTAFLVLGDTRPEYNNKIRSLIAMAPICYLKNIQPPLSLFFVAETLLSLVFKGIGKKEIFGSQSQTTSIIRNVCSQEFIGKGVCLEGGFFHLFGRDEEEIHSDFLPVIFGHYPSSTSLQNMNHLVQLYMRAEFEQYNYGFITNFLVYLSWKPPKYDLDKVTMKVALFFGKNDKVSTWKDSEILRDRLPNVVEYHLMDREQFNHIDFVWGENMNVQLFPHIFEVLQKFD